ncbi:hypothetical protein [Hymenobacter daecheongensis]|nr:hypothetical protein [Hymenobacter daecheongensis]
MDPTRNPAEDTDFDFDAWVRWQRLHHAWQHVAASRHAAAGYRPPLAVEAPAEPEVVYLLPVPN